MSLIILCLFGAYLAISLIIFFATIKKDESPAFEEFPFVSVIIAARNEEKNIRDCLESLRTQRFPQNKYEVIVIDDHSADRTSDIAKAFSEAHENFRYRKLAEGVTGKKQALAFGIKRARGEYIFQIDADCTANENWLSELSSRLGNDYALVGGFTLVRHKKSVAEKVQALEYLYMLSLGKALSRSIRTYSLFGNNTAFKKEAYERAGGYESLSPGMVEDYQLVRAFFECGVGRSQLAFHRNSVVSTEPARSFKDYLEQRKRWSQAALGAMSGWRFSLIPVSLFYFGASIYPFFTEYFAVIIVLRLLADFLVILNPVRRFRQFSLIPYLIFFEINLVLMVIYLGVPLTLSKKIRWKGRVVE
jgi:cellulose synthase/poly-beta-1,6-N-acetylglucosamine synthase-like glycosyltransferase